MMTIMTSSNPNEEVGVAEAKAKLSGLLLRVAAGERFLISRRGRIVAALVPPDHVRSETSPPLGLAAYAGELAEWDDLPTFIESVYKDRERADERQAPELT
jgi:prevent-host-death family protein